VIDADHIGHDVLQHDEDVRNRLVCAFGDEIIGLDGSPNRAVIGQKVFGNAHALDILNRIVHPPLLARLRSSLDAVADDSTIPFVAVDAALITEWRIEDWFDLVLLITAPRHIVRARLGARGLDAEQIDHRIASQVEENVRARKADVTISNDGGMVKLNDEVDRVWWKLVQ